MGYTLERGHGTLVSSSLCFWLGVELFFSATCSQQDALKPHPTPPPGPKETQLSWTI